MSERWKPKSGEEYWVVIGGAAIISTWRSDYADNYRWGMGNCFKTKAEAESAAEKVKALLLSLHEPATECSQLVTDCNQLPDWCKVGEWVYHDSDGYYYTVKSIDIENDNIQITDEESEYTYTANELKTLFSAARLRPYNAEEMKALVGKVIATKEDCAIVTGYRGCENKIILTMEYNRYSAEALLKINATLDGNPCGVFEHLENGEWVQ